MVLELSSLGIAVAALLLAGWGAWVAYRSSAAKVSRRLNREAEELRELLEANEKREKRWREEIEHELGKAVGQYRKASAAYSRSAELFDTALAAAGEGEDGPGGEEESVHELDARRGEERGVQRLPPSLVAAGIWQGGRTG